MRRMDHRDANNSRYTSSSMMDDGVEMVSLGGWNPRGGERVDRETRRKGDASRQRHAKN